MRAFVEEHRDRLEELPRAYGGSHRRSSLIGQPATLVVLERMETAALLRGPWKKEALVSPSAWPRTP
ncbi:hypothetical protein ACIQMY_05425 [Streptomyces sp. NPDC091368]|uniref:hypothetical protein n=1 Tax=Streptomyces sp. NPDC091368 TaxID=3365993 RepID=UPI0037F17C16